MAFELSPGSLVADRFRLDHLIGRGGMGEVWAAEQTVTRRQVAIKFLVGDATTDPDARRRFLREARAACAVVHPNVVQIYDVIEADDGTPALVMERLSGESLESRLRREGKLGLSETLAIMLRVVSAVGTAHQHGVVHRDLKPDNIFLSETPEGVEVKVLDFGIAKIEKSGDGAATGGLTSTGTMLGTPFYMSPEQAFGEKRIDHRSDIWSLGIVLYRCLSGQLPTMADNLGQILKLIMTRSIPKLSNVAPELPAEVTELVDHMLAYEPAARPADLREVKTRLEALHDLEVKDFGPAAVAPGSFEHSLGPAVREAVTAPRAAQRAARAPLYALFVAGLFAVVVVVVVLTRERPGPSPAAADASSSHPSTAVASEDAPATASAHGSVIVSAPPVTEVAGSGSAAVVAASSSSARATMARTTQRPASATAATPPSTAAPSAGFGGIVEKPGF